MDLSKLTLTDIVAERCRRSFYYYVKTAWEHVDPAPYVDNWHIRVICEHLQAVREKRIKKLKIHIPPGSAKSLIVSVLWPTWYWTLEPNWQVLHGSYALPLALRDANKARSLLESDWYIQCFRRKPGFEWDLKDDQNVKSNYATTRKGARLSLSVGSQATGYRGDCVILDDPLSAEQGASELYRESVVEWKKTTMSTRFNDLETSSEVLVMQRLHENDLAGYIEKNEPGWTTLSLPTEFDPLTRCITYDRWGHEFWRDPRKEPGELLFPRKFSKAVIDGLKISLGPYGFAAQHQQRPVPANGGAVRKEWFNRRWIAPFDSPVDGMTVQKLPEKMHDWAIVVDATFKGGPKNDRVAILVVARHGPDLYVLDCAWQQMGILDTLEAIIRLKEKWRQVHKVLIEGKANGNAIVEMLKLKFSGVQEIQPNGGKESRVAAATPAMASNNVLFPAYSTWGEAAIAECCSFPKGEHDDFIDALAYSIEHLLHDGGMAVDELERIYR